MSQVARSQAEEHCRATIDTSLVKVLHKLHDSVDILHDLAKRTKIPEIQQYADRQILQRKIFNQELRLDLSSATNEPLDGTVPGLFRRLSKDVKSLLPNAESNMLEEVEAGETSLRATYLGALEGTSASPDLRDKLHRQQALVARAQAELRSLIAHARLDPAGH